MRDLNTESDNICDEFMLKLNPGLKNISRTVGFEPTRAEPN